MDERKNSAMPENDMNQQTEKDKQNEETKNQKAVDSFVKVIDHETVTIKDIPYNIVENYRDAFNKEELERRYSDIMEKYDYIVADISDEKARLKGFYRSSYKKAPAELRISNLKDYILEYCN